MHNTNTSRPALIMLSGGGIWEETFPVAAWACPGPSSLFTLMPSGNHRARPRRQGQAPPTKYIPPKMLIMGSDSPN
jgi:hypothetical protein